MGKLILNTSLLRSPGQRFSMAYDNMGNLSFYYQPKQMRPPTILQQEWAPGLASNAQSRFLFSLIMKAWSTGGGYSSTGNDSRDFFPVDHAAWLSRAATNRMLLKQGYSRFVPANAWFLRYNLASYFAQNPPAALTPPHTHNASLLPPMPLNYFTAPPDAVYSPPIITSVVPSTNTHPRDPFPTIETTPPIGPGLVIGPSLGRPHTNPGRAEYGPTIAGVIILGQGYIGSETPTGALNGINHVFSLATPPAPAASLRLFRNGLLLSQGMDYTLAANLITTTQPPQTGDTLKANYRYTANSTGIASPAPLTPGQVNWAWAAIQPISLPPTVDPADPSTWGNAVMPILTPGPRKFFLVPVHPAV